MRPIVYVRADEPGVLRQHHYHLWSDPPPTMLRDALVDYLREGVASR